MAKPSASQNEKGAPTRLRLFRKAKTWLGGLKRRQHRKYINFKNWGRSIKNLWQPIKEVIQEKHRFVVMDSHTFKEKFSFQLSGINLFVTVGISIIVLVVLTSLLIAFTPLREFIPGYANTKMVEQTYRNAVVIDSLERQLASQEWMLQSIQQLLSGEQLPGEEAYGQSVNAEKPQAVSYTRSKADSLLRRDVEREDSKYQVKGSADKHAAPAEAAPAETHLHAVNEQIGLSLQLFFPPLKGSVIGSYDQKLRHFGVDIAGPDNAPIMAAYNGTVIFSNYTVQTGYVVAIQHPGNVISVYKHNGALLKQAGDAVRAGEPIAYLGNSGELTTGPHLHFELWIAGKPVDPAKYISF